LITIKYFSGRNCNPPIHNGSRVGSKGFEFKIDLKPLSSIDFVLRFVFFICPKFFSHLFMNLDVKSMRGRGFEPNFEFKTL
jgi:hypothetical protein